MKCEYCNTPGVRHSGVFSCVRDLKDRYKDYRNRLRSLEDLVLKLYDHNAIRPLGLDDHEGHKMILELRKMLDLDDTPYDMNGNNDIGENSSRLD